MKKSMKAPLLSAFVFPGAGHFFLRKYVPGIILSGTEFSALYIIITKTVARALQIVEKIQSSEVQPDAATIAELVSKQPMGTEGQVLNIATVILIFIWLIGIVDSYRTGRALDKGAVTPVNKFPRPQGKDWGERDK
jgi:hypothetical protein